MNKLEAKLGNLKKALERLKEAYAQKIIINEQIWLSMIKDRNTTSHMYLEKMAIDIAERITNCYINEFDKLLEALSTEL